MASRYSSAPGNALRNFSERKCDTRHGSMIVFGSMTILRLWSGVEMNSSTFMVTSFFFEYFDTAMAAPRRDGRPVDDLAVDLGAGHQAEARLADDHRLAGLPTRLPVEVHE